MYIDEKGDLCSFSVGELLTLPCKHCGHPARDHKLGDVQMHMSGETTCKKQPKTPQNPQEPRL